ncbi:phenylacetate--CoA ligase family protein [Mesobacillus zeae]|nr:phenylacetate--CoA ligase family protein [Mesobacillus zeae]
MFTNKQLNQAKEILSYAKEHTEFYKKALEHTDIAALNYSDFQEIPILTKEKLIFDQQEFVSKSVDYSSVMYEYTSGTTGEPFSIPRTKDDKLRTSITLLKERQKRIGRFPGLKFATFFAGSSEVVTEAEEGWLNITVKDLNEESMNRIVEKLIDYKPDFLQGSSRVLTYLAEFILTNKIDMKQSQIKMIENRAEGLLSTQKELLEQAFMCPVANMYGLRESWGVAYSCDFNHLHIMNDNVFVEILDEFGDFAGFDQTGHIHITCFHSKAMPLIRYDTGDIGMLSKKQCACGNPSFILELSGYRKLDMIQTPAGFSHPSILKYLNDYFIKNKFGIIQFQVVQEGLNAFTLRCHSLADLHESQVRQLKDKFQELLGYEASVKVIQTNHFVLKEFSSKFKWFVSNC